MDVENSDIFEQRAEAASGGPRAGDGHEKDAFGQVVEQSKHTARSISRQVGSQTKSFLASRKDHIARQLHELATALRQTGNKLREEDRESIAEAADVGAAKVEQFSGYLKEQDIDEMVDKVEDFARHRPALFVGGALAAGFLLGQIFRSNSDDRTREERIPESEYGSSAGYGLEKSEETPYERH